MTSAFAKQRCADAAAMAMEAARLLTAWIARTLQTKPQCLIALSGGSTPVRTYETLAATAGIDWSRVVICLVDERMVGMDQPESNAGLVMKAFASATGITFLLPNPALGLPATAEDYEKRLTGKAIDIAVLGMGDDGHTASLFPPVTDEGLSRMGIVHTTTDRFAIHDRVSMALPMLKSATHRLLLLQGQQKLSVWEELLAAAPDEKRWPLQTLLDERLTVLSCT